MKLINNSFFAYKHNLNKIISISNYNFYKFINKIKNYFIIWILQSYSDLYIIMINLNYYKTNFRMKIDYL